MKNKYKWKNNFLKIPKDTIATIKNKSLKRVVVASIKKISLTDIEEGVYSHLNIKIVDDKINFPKNIIPKSEAGKYSSINIYGKEVVRKDLPKINKTFSWEVPNYGDWYNGSHTITNEREVYQRDFIAPKELDIQISLIEHNKKENTFVLKFQVNEVISTENEHEFDLLYDINLLQENIGAFEIYPPDTTDEEFLKTIYVDWEILPIGTKDILDRLMADVNPDNIKIRKKYKARYNLLEKLKPIAFVKGTNSFRRYFGAQFSDNLVVFENLEYGNAIYVMNEKWEKLSKLSRIDLLKMENNDFTRIVHIGGWEDLLKSIVREKLSNK